jgi:hypothetical protein
LDFPYFSEAELVNAFRKVIESLQSDPSQPLWMFGVTVLKTCRAFLHKYPKMCHMIYQTNNYSKLPPFLKDYVTAGVSGTLPTGHSTTEAPEYSPWSHAGSSVAASTGFGPIGGGISHSSVQSTTPTGIHFPSIKFPAPKGTNVCFRFYSVSSLLNDIILRVLQ